MPSASTRIEIVTRAVKQAGRSAELHAHAKELLNDLLRGCAINLRYKVLRKVGAPMVLPAGSNTVDFPADFGAATESIVLVDQSDPLIEYELSDFIDAGGFPKTGDGVGRPFFYNTDTNARMWRFNRIADQNYTFIPVYYYLPANIPTVQSSDQDLLWYENDESIIEGLIWKLYVYIDDARELAQKNTWMEKDAQYRRGTLPIQGGAAKLRLSRSTFPSRRLSMWWIRA